MTADSYDNHPYVRSELHTTRKLRQHYWAVAIGLQDVDGLKVSPYLRTVAKSYIENECTLEETGKLVREYHLGKNHLDTVEADLVSQRIAEVNVI